MESIDEVLIKYLKLYRRVSVRLTATTQCEHKQLAA